MFAAAQKLSTLWFCLKRYSKLLVPELGFGTAEGRKATR